MQNDKEKQHELDFRNKVREAIVDKRDDIDDDMNMYNELCKEIDKGDPSRVRPSAAPYQTKYSMGQRISILQYRSLVDAKERLEDRYFPTGR